MHKLSRLLAASLVWVVLFATFVGPVPVLSDSVHRVWTDKTVYYIGESIVIHVQPTPAIGVAYWLVIVKPDGSKVKTDTLHAGQDTITIQAGNPTGKYKVELWGQIVYPNATPAIVATCSFEVRGGCSNPFSYPTDLCLHKEIRLKQLDSSWPSRSVIVDVWAKEKGTGVFVNPNSLVSGKNYVLIIYAHESNVDACAGAGKVGCAHFESSYDSVVFLEYTDAVGARGDVKVYGKIGVRYDMSDARWVQLGPSTESTDRLKAFMIVAGLTPEGPLISYFDILGLINAYINRQITAEENAMIRGFNENEFDYLVLPVYQYSLTTPYEYRAEAGLSCTKACAINIYLAVAFTETVYPIGSRGPYYFVGKAFGLGVLGSFLSTDLVASLILPLYPSAAIVGSTSQRMQVREDRIRRVPKPGR